MAFEEGEQGPSSPPASEPSTRAAPATAGRRDAEPARPPAVDVAPDADAWHDDWGTPLRMCAFTGLTGLVIAAASILPYGGVGLVLLSPVLRRAGTMLGPKRAGLVPPLTLVFAAPVLLLMPLLMMRDPVVESTWKCGTAQMGGLVVLPVLAFVAGLVSAAGALIVAGFLPRVVEAAARWLRAVVLLVGAGLVVAGTVRLSRFPQPDDWVGSLRVAATSDGLDTAQLGTCRDGCRLPPLPFEAAATSRTLLLECKTDRCTIALGDASGRALARSSAHDGAASPGAPVEVRVHDALGIAVVAQQGRSMVAFEVARGQPVDVPLRDVAREVAPSPLAVLAMAFALGVAFQRTRRALGERAALARLATGVDARIDDAGVVHPEDGGASFRPPGVPLAEGPGVILGRPSPGTYRSGADRGTWVLPGLRASHVAVHRRRGAVFDWEALAVTCAAGAPLFAAALRGLLL